MPWDTSASMLLGMLCLANEGHVTKLSKSHIVSAETSLSNSI